MLLTMQRIMSIIMSIVFFLPSAFISKKAVDMPDTQAGEYGQHVDPFIGTGGIPWTCAMLSTAATTPFGSVRLGPDTSFGGGAYIFKTNTSGYYYNQNQILGFSHTRFSGTGAEEGGLFRVTPSVGNADVSKRLTSPLSYSHKNEVASPGYYAVYLPSVSCMAEMTATTHVGLHRYTFNSKSDAHLFLDAESFLGGGDRARDGEISVSRETGEITGKCTLTTEFSGRYDGLTAYFAAQADAPIQSFTTWSENGVGADLNFGSIGGKSVELKLGISYVSLDNARENLEAEAGDLDFDSVKAASREEWERYLSRIQIDADNETKKTFYTALYHAMIMPTNFTDVNGEYLGFDREVHTAEGFTYRTDMSLWDSFRTEHPLLTLIAPEIQLDCVKSLVLMAQQGGALPRWPAGGGYTGSMFGTPADMVLAETYLKGLTDFDAEAALHYMKLTSDGTVEGTDNREGIAEYNKLGYVPAEVTSKAVSRTLEYAWADGSISLLADALGHEEDAAEYHAKSMNYKNVFDPQTKYFRARNADGSWHTPFNPNITNFYDAVVPGDYANDYCEGGARHWRWSAVQDPQGLIELFGGEEYFVSELDDFMSDASRSRAAIDPGPGWWVGNQHDIHAPYLFNEAGRADLTQKWVRWTLAERFSNDYNGLDGNDDGGTLSAWYIFSALGFYPAAGSDKYWIGSPCIDKAVINMGGGKTLTIIAENQSKDNVYVQSVSFNGNRLTDSTMVHSLIANGGTFVFKLGASPAENGGY